MSDDRLVRLSERWNAGDADAAEELFEVYAPYLRMVVRRQLTTKLRARFDSHDVVQSVWTDALIRAREGRTGWVFRDAAALRAFFVRMARNRFIDFCRRNRPSLDRERSLSAVDVQRLTDNASRPSEVAQADELWAKLFAMTPPDHHAIVTMKSQGAPLAEIASRTGLHPSSVRRILYELKARIAHQEATSLGGEDRPTRRAV
ncbi:MAG: RNA polymerase sigma factor [Isosphaeraceae bacterium]